MPGTHPPANVLILYQGDQTFTNTLSAHLASFAEHSSFRIWYASIDRSSDLHLDLARFDAVVVHYSVRLAFDQLSPATAEALSRFAGLKVPFAQDEYDLTEKLRKWIERLGIGLFFTCVPEHSRERVYPSARFPATRFATTLTGYVDESLLAMPPPPPIASRAIDIGYRGRALAYWYGALGREKESIARVVRGAARDAGLKVDIEWDESKRIYGDAWYGFLASCKATLGTESGSNVFDDDGSLRAAVSSAMRRLPRPGYEEIHGEFIGSREVPGMMNQISPRIFEAVATRTALVLFEGSYSGILQPGTHFIALKKGFENLAEVLESLRDAEALQAMVERAHADIVQSGNYSYAAFVRQFDSELRSALAATAAARPAPVRSAPLGQLLTPISTQPMRVGERNWRRLDFSATPIPLRYGLLVVVSHVWEAMPEYVQIPLRWMARPVYRALKRGS